MVFRRKQPDSTSPSTADSGETARTADVTGGQDRAPDQEAPRARRGLFFRRREAPPASAPAGPETPPPGDRDDTESRPAPAQAAASLPAQDASQPADQPADEQPATDADGSGFFGRLRSGLARTRSSLAEGVGNLILGERFIDDEVLDDLETALIVSDVGVGPVATIMDALKLRVSRKELNNTGALFRALGEELTALLATNHKPFEVRSDTRPFVVLVVGVNGVGKTTTIGKLAAQLTRQGRSVVMAAGDTFRAAAVEQLAGWGERTGVPVIAQGQGADSASVIFDALEAARARDVDVVLADTAGRLQTKTNLMEELRKVRRVVSRFDPQAPHEVLLVLDATTGQNALNQAREFLDATGVTGLVLTKLDGTAKGGMAFAVAQETGLPIYFVGVGEAVDDLRPFEPEAFVKALLAQDGDLAD